MRQQEAEQEAARRNAEDERRDRFVFYPLDHSAGMSPDAWEVEMRLRDRDGAGAAALGPLAATAPATPVGRLRPAPPRTPPRALAPGPTPATALPEALPEPDAASAYGEEELLPEAEPQPQAPRRRRPRLLQLWAAVVILVGLAFIGATVGLAVVLRDYTHFGALPTAIGIGLGLLAVWIGILLARTPRG